MAKPACPYQAILFLSFGGPEGDEDVIPFLENVLQGKNVPRERMLEVAEHYYHFGGKSPINDQNRAIIEALEKELKAYGPDIPVYFGNRNWHPLLPDTLRKMKADGVQRALAFFTSAFSCYSGCRQYLEDVTRAQEDAGPGAPEIDNLRMFYNHPGFVEPLADAVRAALNEVHEERRQNALLLFTAHSLPVSMAERSSYVHQLEEACRLVAEQAGQSRYELVYQSRSGPPHQPWLEPDVCDYIEENAGQIQDLLVLPIGFISAHMEVLFDLDTECTELCQKLGISMARLPTVDADPRFAGMIRELIWERIGWQQERRALGSDGPSHDVCPQDCCLAGAHPGQPGGLLEGTARQA